MRPGGGLMRSSFDLLAMLLLMQPRIRLASPTSKYLWVSDGCHGPGTATGSWLRCHQTAGTHFPALVSLFSHHSQMTGTFAGVEAIPQGSHTSSHHWCAGKGCAGAFEPDVGCLSSHEM